MAQLGTKRTSLRVVTLNEWLIVREHMLNASVKRGADPELCAYTPGETLDLIRHPEIEAWHKRAMGWKLAPWVKIVCFVPCAKSKPWTEKATRRSLLYKAYHKIIKRRERGDPALQGVFFVTISEPLGIVPETLWHDFPKYDNPGLFKNSAQQSGLFKSDWLKLVGAARFLPFDHKAYHKSIILLGSVIQSFMGNNPDVNWVGFVDSRDYTKSTHADMLDKVTGHDIKRYRRMIKPRTWPYEHIRNTLKGLS